MLNQKWYKVSKPEMEFHMINKIYAALSMRAQTDTTTQLYIDEAQAAQDILSFAVFFFCYCLN